MDIDSQRTAAEEARVFASEMTCEALSQLRRSIQVSKGKDSKQLSDCDRSAVLFASDFRSEVDAGCEECDRQLQADNQDLTSTIAKTCKDLQRPFSSSVDV